MSDHSESIVWQYFSDPDPGRGTPAHRCTDRVAPPALGRLSRAPQRCGIPDNIPQSRTDPKRLLVSV
jgi:hypothetical protein